MTLSSYSKSLTALIAGAVAWGGVVVASPSAAITAAEWLELAGVVATALGVYAIPNAPSTPPVSLVSPPSPMAPPSTPVITNP